MTIGEGGKYDDLATLVRRISGGQGVCVIVMNGVRGSGFAQQIAVTDTQQAGEVTLELVRVLRDVASQLERDARVLATKAKA